MLHVIKPTKRRDEIADVVIEAVRSDAESVKPPTKVTILVERMSSGHRKNETWRARVKGDEDAHAVWMGKTRNEAVGALVVHLAFSLNLRVVQHEVVQHAVSTPINPDFDPNATLEKMRDIPVERVCDAAPHRAGGSGVMSLDAVCTVCGFSRKIHESKIKNHPFSDREHITNGTDRPIAINPDFDPNVVLKMLREIRRESDVRGCLPDEELVNVLVTQFGDLDDWLSNRGRLPTEWRRVADSSDWTGGLAGTSPKFIELVADVERMIFDSAHALIHGDAASVARKIVGRLAYTHGLAPQEQK
jgi:hypothetical protein